MIIRQAKEQDAASVKELLIQLGYPNLTLEEVAAKIKIHESENYSLLVAEEDGDVWGFISLHWFEFLHAKGKIGRITAFCVDERSRSKGIGKQLLQEAEIILTKNGCTKFEVTSNQTRARTHQFYLSNGYIEDSKRFVKYVKP